ncbi:tryptophan halogenase [Microbulbifer agarilyticus]|uniref:Tryptophan halogenase n=1 Tax=Microbulbifer agarilyticus TaxID=260552 RepID=A0A1Q2M3F9_9GAMM|nr:tryptophan halogenase [Microbulbifer agarilyticus]
MVDSRFSVLIVGGGTAGWMAANLLAHHWRDFPVKISLVESTEIATVGVGEGSTPFLKNFFRTLGIDESEWMPACDATYKSGIRFPNWSKVPGYESYYHPFFSPLDRETGQEFFAQANLRRQGEAVEAVPDYFFHAPYLSAAGKAPIPKRPLPFELDYAYHFDAGLLGKFLRDKAIKAGVEHKQATIERVLVESGKIAGLQTTASENLAADFYIDCTGFRSALLAALPGYQFNEYSDTLFNNAAVTLQVPSDGTGPIKSETVSEAMSAGWMWDIPLQSRTGYGYVYSDQFLSAEQAEQELRGRLGKTDELECRHLKMRVGRVAEHWSGNCLGVGLSQGFIEPLEATALMLVQFTVEQFARSLLVEGMPNPGASITGADLGAPREHFNRTINEMFAGVRDYVAGHYLLNTRDDSPYWQAVRDQSKPPERLLKLMDCWDSGGDFPELLSALGADKIYSMASWYCLFAGMGRFPETTGVQSVESQKLIRELKSFCGGNTGRFNEHRAYLQALK